MTMIPHHGITRESSHFLDKDSEVSDKNRSFETKKVEDEEQITLNTALDEWALSCGLKPNHKWP